MAFIRWKKNKFGIRQAYLVHAYRDVDGKPKQKTLAYLGPNADLSAEKLALIKQRHRRLPIQWDKISPAAKPPSVDVTLLSDAEMLKRLDELRQARGMTKKRMVEALLAAGVSSGSSTFRRGEILNLAAYRFLEKMYTTGAEFHFYVHPEQEFIPFIRKVLESNP